MQSLILRAHSPINTMFTKDDTLLAKAAAVFLMLAHHLFSFPYRIAPSNSYISMFSMRGSPVEYLIGVFGGVCVNMFMVLSGYGTYLKFCEVSADMFLRTAVKKLLRVYKCVWGVFAIFVPLGLVLRADNIVWKLDTFLLNFFGLHLTYNSEWWFLTPFLILTLFSPLLVKWLLCKKSVLSVDILTVFFFVFLLEPMRQWAHAQDSLKWLTESLVFEIFSEALGLFPLFFIGCLLAKYNFFNCIFSLIKSRFALYICSVACLAIAFWLMPEAGVLEKVVFTPLIILACVTLLRDIPIVRPSMIVIGKKSTGIWLIHTFFCYYYFQRLVYMPRYSPLVFLWLLLLSFVSACGVDWFWHLVGLSFSKIKQKIDAILKPTLQPK